MKIRKGMGILAGIIVSLCCLSMQARAYVRVDVTHEAALSLYYPCPEAEFRLFRVADMSETAGFTLMEEFQDAGVSLQNADSEVWEKATKQLAAYAEREKLSPIEVKKTDKSGNLSFSGEKTTVGLYLILGKKQSYQGADYTPMPSLVSLPGLKADDAWEYEVKVRLKYEKKSHPTDKPEEPGKPPKEHRPKPPVRPAGTKLPQTGQLWWPVPLLLLAGGFLCMEGVRRRRRDGRI